MQRLAIPLVIAGSAALLVVLFLLVRSLDRDAAEPSPSSTGSAAPTATAVAPTPAAPRAPAGRATLPPIARRPAPESAPTPARDDRPQLAPERPPPGTLTDENLEYGTPQLGEQIAAVEPLVADCVKRTAAAGHRLTGRAELTFIVAKQGDKILVEDTGLDPEQTTIDSAPLLECLHETSRAMKFKGLPRNADALIVTRRVDIADGALVNNAYVKFSYIR